MVFKALTPMLHTASIDTTRSWYESMLGFRCVAQEAGWCRLVRDNVAIMFMENDHLGPPHATATQYIYVDDVMALFDALAGRCAVAWGPEKMSYGMLEFAIKDPNGYLLSFGQQVAE